MQIDFIKKWSNYWFIALTAAVILAHVLINRQAGLSFPTPWPDEAHFLWQANAISTNNTLFAPELNTERTIMWMPPGYMFLTGLMFKITGTSLESARILSLIAMIVFFVLLVEFLVGFGHRWYALVLASLFFLNAQFIACGNVARMEALLLLAVISAFLLIQRGRCNTGLAILGLSPLLHFNGFFFLLAGLSYILFIVPAKEWTRLLNRKLLMAALIVLAGWISYAFIIYANWESFVQDMSYQFGRKSERSFWSEISGAQYLSGLSIAAICGVYARTKKLRAFELLFLAVPSILIWPIGHELWYEVIDHLGFLLVSVFVIHVGLHLLNEIKDPISSWAKLPLLVILLIGILWWNYSGQRIENVFDYSSRAELLSMKVVPEVPYLTSDDQIRLSGLLSSLFRKNGGLTVEFQPDADALSFVELKRDGVNFVCPLFEKREADILVVHLSRNLPPLYVFEKQALARLGLTHDIEKYAWYKRDSTEMWIIGDLKRKFESGEKQPELF